MEVNRAELWFQEEPLTLYLFMPNLPRGVKCPFHSQRWKLGHRKISPSSFINTQNGVPFLFKRSGCGIFTREDLNELLRNHKQ
jgi:hypothetical protein